MVERARDRDWVCVAVVATAHGLRGMLKLRCFTERPEDVAAYGPVFDQNGRRFELEVIGPAPGGVLARAQGIGDRSAAEALRPDGSRFGIVQGVANFGAGDLIEVVADDGRRVSLPFTREAVPSIDLERRRLVVEAPDELVAEVAS